MNASTNSHGDRFGNYERLRVLGRGGHATVYLARRLGEKKRYALKCMNAEHAADDKLRRAFALEIQITQRLSHEHSCQIYDYGEVGGVDFFVMDYVDGHSLNTLLKELAEGRWLLPVPFTLHIIRSVLSVVAVAHELRDERGAPLNIVHRDLTPHNVLIGVDGTIKVIDFGIADVSSKQDVTRAGLVKGKLLYMAPEQAMGKRVTQSVDLYSAGLMLYQMLTGVLPTDAEGQMQIYQRVVTAQFEAPSVLNPTLFAELEVATMRALQREPHMRYPSARAFVQTLDGLLAQFYADFRADDYRAFIAKHWQMPSKQSILKRFWTAGGLLSWLLLLLAAGIAAATLLFILAMITMP